MATFSKQLWEMVKTSPKVKSAVDAFTIHPGDDLSKLAEYFGSVSTEVYPPELYYSIVQIESSAYKDNLIPFDTFNFWTFMKSLQLYEFQYLNGEVVVDDDGFPVMSDKLIMPMSDYRGKASIMEAISMYLYHLFGCYKPVLPGRNFLMFQRNCDILGIDLPVPPRSKDYVVYIQYYYDICESINKWQEELELTDAEACACIYEVAPALVEKPDVPIELPKPTNIWLTGASKQDIQDIETQESGFTSVWTCNERTRRGDIIVLYGISPNSCIHSIWRAGTGGYFCPFDYFQNRTTVVDGVLIPRISLKELHEDPVFGALPMMRNNLQGINGKELPATAYSALLEMIERKGGDLSSVPVLYQTKGWNPGTIKLEKDVEEKILIPVLKDLGYSEEDWTRQLSLQAGRGMKAIPDFVFFATGDEHHEVAPFVIEAKLNMSSNLQRRRDFNQGVSYAKMLSATILGMCDEERLLIYKRTRDGKFNYEEPVFEHHWAEISSDIETFAQLKKLISPEAVKKYM